MGGVLKELLPLGRRQGSPGDALLPAPVIAWSLLAGLQAGMDSGLVVTSSSKAAALMEVIASLDLPIPFSYLHQPLPAGLGAAVACAAPHVDPDDLIVTLLPDAVMWPGEVVGDAVRVVEQGAMACATLFSVETPERFGAARCDEDGRVVGFVDQPAVADSPWVWTAVVFRTGFFAYIERTLTERGEGGLTPALDLARREGALEVRQSTGGAYLDVGTYEGYMEALGVFATSGFGGSLSDLAACAAKPPTSPSRESINALRR
jgi:dTDP-glucose pyrophosphorylase